MSYESLRRRVTRAEAELQSVESAPEKRSRLLRLIATATDRTKGEPARDLSNKTDAELLEVIGATAEEFDEAARGFAAMIRGERAKL